MNVTRPSPVTSRVCGLGDVVQQRREPQRLARASARWPAARRAASTTSPAPSPPTPAAVALELDRRAEHRLRVVVDVEVVIGALLDSAQPRELREHRRGRAERVHQRQPGQRAVGDHDPLELGEHPLGGDACQRRRALDRARSAVRGSTSKSSSQASRARRSVRSGSAANASGETIRSRRAWRSSTPPNGSTARRSRQRLGDRVDRQVAPAPGRPRSCRRRAAAGRSASRGRGRSPARPRTPPRARTRTPPAALGAARAAVGAAAPSTTTS